MGELSERMPRLTDPYHPEPCTPAQKFENALIALRRATDSRGLRIRLGPSNYSSAAYRDYIKQYAHEWFRTYKIVYLDDGADEPGEVTFARNFGLLVNAYQAALEYEYANKTARA